MRRTWAAWALAASAATASGEDEPEIPRLSAREGLTLAGRVVGGDKPVLVRLWRYEFEDTGDWYHRTQQKVVTVAPGGEYRFEGLPPGRYGCDFADQKLTFTGGAPDVDLLRDATDRTLTVPTNCRLRGKVLRSRKTASRASVSLGYFDVEVAADGSYETPDVAPGDYVARIDESWETGTFPREFESVRREIAVHLDGVTTLDVALEPDATIPVAVRSSRDGESFEGRVGARSDRVRVEQGWFRVVVEGGRALVERTFPMFPHGADGWSGPAGTFALEGLAPGPTVVRLSAIGFAPWEREIVVGPGAHVDAVMNALPGEFVTAPGLPKVARIEIRPARGAWRELVACDRRMVSMGAAYESPIVDFLAPGAYEWRAESLEGAPTTAQPLAVDASRGIVTLAPAFASGRTLHGRLTTKSGVALGGVRVRFAVKDGDAWRFIPTKDAPTDPTSGAFETKGLSPGRWRVQLDEQATVVLGEFDVADADVTRTFAFVPR